MNVQHIAAAALLVASLTTASLSQGQKVEAPPTDQAKCLTRKDVLAQADVLFDLAGDELTKFHKHYTEQYHREPPDLDRLMVVNVGAPELVLLVKFKSDCAVGMQYVPLDEFMKVLKGAPS
jgi:hypothetical protein